MGNKPGRASGVLINLRNVDLVDASMARDLPQNASVSTAHHEHTLGVVLAQQPASLQPAHLFADGSLTSPEARHALTWRERNIANSSCSSQYCTVDNQHSL